MTQSFDEWFDSQDDVGCTLGLEGYAARKAWDAQQAKIDELQKRIGELEWFAKSIRNWDAHPKDLEINNGSWGVRDFYRNYADNVLKGEPNDN